MTRNLRHRINRIKDRLSYNMKRRLRERREGLIHLYEHVLGGRIAMPDALVKGWEPWLTRIRYRLTPDKIRRELSELSDAFAELEFSDLDVQKPDIDFVNYHSICYGYRRLRFNTTVNFFSLMFLVVVFVLLPILFYYIGITGFLVDFGGLPTIQDSPDLIYSLSAGTDYYIEIQDISWGERDYELYLGSPPSEARVFPENETKARSINYGDVVQSSIRSDDDHLYRIQGNGGETIIIHPHRWYADASLQFALLKPDMTRCNTLDVLERDLSVVSGSYLHCEVEESGKYYLRIQVLEDETDNTLGFRSAYQFAVYQASSDLFEEESNDGYQTATAIAFGELMLGTINSDDHDYFHLSSETDRRLLINTIGLSESSHSSITLHKKTERVDQGLTVVDHSTRSQVSPPGIGQLHRTAYGRALMVWLYLKATGIERQPAELIGSWYLAVYYLITVPVALLILVYIVYYYQISPHRYEESSIVWDLILVLRKLQDNDVLKSELRKANLRFVINRTADRIPRISGIRWLPVNNSAPKAMKYHLRRMAAQLRKMTMAVSAPYADTQSYLRECFSRWLTVFLRAEYGRFPFEEGFEMQPEPWYRYVHRHWLRPWWKPLLATIAVGLIGGAALLLEFPYEREFFELVWWVARCLVLNLLVYSIYDQWGIKGPSDEPASQWEHAVRLVLFFFVPFFVLDNILNTGISDFIARLIGQLDVF